LKWATISAPKPGRPRPRCQRDRVHALSAAGLIGQLGDPHYLRKANALCYEFEEVGTNKQLGYASPADLTDLYPQFYWSSISPHI